MDRDTIEACAKVADEVARAWAFNYRDRWVSEELSDDEAAMARECHDTAKGIADTIRALLDDKK